MGMLLTRHYVDNSKKIQGATKKVAPSIPAEKKEKVEVKEPVITEKDIKAMSGNKLRKLAKQQGIENPEELTVGELKSILCEKLGK